MCRTFFLEKKNFTRTKKQSRGRRKNTRNNDLFSRAAKGWSIDARIGRAVWCRSVAALRRIYSVCQTFGINVELLFLGWA
jgi:hypothetical protein